MTPDEQLQLAPLMLSPRRIDVLALLLQGRSNKEIARDLSLSVETVKEHVGIILHRLGLRSRAQIPMNVRPLHEPLLAWDAARRERVRPYLATKVNVSHHAL
jgi:DNA-binding NarL/FixJ family response regulator